MDRRGNRLPLLATAAMLLLGCGGESQSPCVPGETSSCECDASVAGSRECDTGGRFGACSCDGTTGDGDGDQPLTEMFASIGEWCGDRDRLESWLVVTPRQTSCEDHAASVGGAGDQDGVALRIDALPIADGAGSFETVARRCRRGTCEDYPASLSLSNVTQGRGGNGTYRIALGDGSFDEGRFSAKWCTWETWAESPPPGMLARGMRIDEIALYQGVKVSLMSQGEANVRTNAPVVAGRAGILRLYLGTDDEWEPRDFRVRLTLRQPDGSTLEEEIEANEVAVPSEDAPDSTFNFALAADDVREGTQYVIELLETEPCIESSGSDDAARWPINGRDTLGARAVGGLNVTLVPIAYGAGGGETPVLDPQMLADIEAEIGALLPVEGVQLSVREPVLFDASIEPTCPDQDACAWNDLLGALVDLRVDDGAPPDEYYYGMVMPGTDLDSYCNGNCILGVGAVTRPGDQLLRVATGIGFSDLAADRASTLTTIVHELAHTMGRDHTACGNPDGVDAAYPYAGGGIGSWGHDRRSDAYLSPDTHTDIMGYCSPPWISDYTYEGIAERLEAVNSDVPPLSAAEPNLQAFIGNGAMARWTRPLPAGTMRGLEMDGPETMAPGQLATVVDVDGRAIAQTRVRGVSLPDTGATMWFVPQPQPGWDRLRFEDGNEVDLARRTPVPQLRSMGAR